MESGKEVRTSDKSDSRSGRASVCGGAGGEKGPGGRRSAA